MYELNQVSGNSYYIQSPAKIGLVRLNDTDVCLIDSGNDKEAGRKVRQLLDQNGWHLTAIYNTHSNADHIGGNLPISATSTCKTRLAARSMPPASSVTSRATHCSSPRFSTAAIRRRICATNSSWPSRATRRS